MITAKAYNGFACDAWSIGCIFLELLIGREDFTRLWMGSYAIEVLTDIPAFRDEIQRRSSHVLSLIAQEDRFERIRDECSAILRGLLCVDPATRWSMNQLHDHPWLEGKAKCISETVQRELGIARRGNQPGTLLLLGETGGESKLAISDSPPGYASVRKIALSPSVPAAQPSGLDDQIVSSKPTYGAESNSGSLLIPPRPRQRPHSAGTGKRSLGARRKQNLSVATGFASERASPTTMKQRAGQLRLPPIDAPDTPKVRRVKKILDSGKELLRSVGISESPTRFAEKSGTES